MSSERFVTLSSLLLPEPTHATSPVLRSYEIHNRQLAALHRALLFRTYIVVEQIRDRVGEVKFDQALGELKNKWKHSMKDRNALNRAIESYNQYSEAIKRTPRQKLTHEELPHRESKVSFDDKADLVLFDPEAPANPKPRRKSLMDDQRNLA